MVWWCKSNRREIAKVNQQASREVRVRDTGGPAVCCRIDATAPGRRNRMDAQANDLAMSTAAADSTQGLSGLSSWYIESGQARRKPGCDGAADVCQQQPTRVSGSLLHTPHDTALSQKGATDDSCVPRCPSHPWPTCRYQRIVSSFLNL